MIFADSMTLGAARAQLRELVDDGHECPCCRQFAKVYRRRIHAGMARDLIRFDRAAGDDWAHLPTAVPVRGGDFCKLRYWGLVEEEIARREDGGRAGFWRMTEAGALFVRERVRVPSHVRLYDGRKLGLDGDLVSIRDCLPNPFDYDELMTA